MYEDEWKRVIAAIRERATYRVLDERQLRELDIVPTPHVPGIAGAVLQQIEAHPETHDQSGWHSECGTKHCAAGWVVTIAGNAGKSLEGQFGPEDAAVMILRRAHGEVPLPAPFGPTDDPLPWLRELAGRTP